MRIEKDYEELLRLFNKNKVKYCIIGAYAVAFHVTPRYTKDIDILVEPNMKNAKKIVKSLNEFGFENLGLKEDDFVKKGKIIQLGYEPVRIDLITSIKGCSFKKIWDNKIKGIYGKEKVHFIGINELIKSKEKSNRVQDKADLKILLDRKIKKSTK
jgi:hypothetical protein